LAIVLIKHNLLDSSDVYFYFVGTWFNQIFVFVNIIYEIFNIVNDVLFWWLTLFLLFRQDEFFLFIIFVKNLHVFQVVFSLHLCFNLIFNLILTFNKVFIKQLKIVIHILIGGVNMRMDDVSILVKHSYSIAFFLQVVIVDLIYFEDRPW